MQQASAAPLEQSPLACVVGLGASAGGLEALQTFFAHMPVDSGLSFVVIQHLSPDYKSLMVELLSKTTTMRVLRIENGMRLEPDTVYLIPPRKNVTLFHQQLLLVDQYHGRGLNLPIDLFFRSLAEDMGERAVGIIRVWTAGCATGEEAYSIAILLREEMLRQDKAFDVKVFATDIDRGAIETASGGLYPASIAAEISEERLKRFFVDKGGAYQVAREIREMVVFAPHNLLKDPPFTKIDMVSCRNMLIYLQPVLQQRVLSLFSFSLLEGGVLFLGGSETTGDLVSLFDAVDTKWKIFIRRSGLAAPLDSNISLGPSLERLLRAHFTPAHDSRRAIEETVIADIQGRLLAQYAPVCLLVDEAGELLHSFGRLPDYLRLSGGRASLNVIKMLPKELSLALSTALHRCLKERQEVVYNNIRLAISGGEGRVTNLRVEPMPIGSGQQLRLLVYLEELRPPAPATGAEKNYDPQTDQSQHIKDLEHELQMSRESLQATVEELETSNEELQATNEELLASNEELQSTNEELQSVNEELYTVNAEYQNKIGELTELNNDIENLLASAHVGSVFLDADLRIRKFTSSVAKELNLLLHDVGRPLVDLGHPLLKAISDAIPEALRGKRIDRVVAVEGGRWLLARILPYESHSRLVQGVVITLINVTEVKLAEAALENSARFIQGVIDAMPSHICVLNEAGTIEAVNEAWKQFILNNPPLARSAGPGANYLHICETAHGDHAEEASAMAKGIREVIAGNRSTFVLEYPCDAPGHPRWFVARVFRFPGQGPARVVVTHEETTGKKRLNEA